MPDVKQVESGQAHPLLVVLEARGLTQAAFAEMVEYSPFYLNRVIRGHHPGGRKFWRACSRVLGVSESALFHDTTTPKQAA